MAKIFCTCGQTILDQSDFIRNKAHMIADQDYMDFFDEIENASFNKMTSQSAKYFNEIFQCDNCCRLMIFKKNINESITFLPEDKNKSKEVLRSYLGDQWLGIMYANFENDQGMIYWSTNLESGFREKLSLADVKKMYQSKFDELLNLKILRHSFLRIDGKIEHEFSSLSH